MSLRFVTSRVRVRSWRSTISPRNGVGLGSLGLREGTEPRELFGNRRYDDERAATLELDPYGYRWVRFEAGPAGALPAISREEAT